MRLTLLVSFLTLGLVVTGAAACGAKMCSPQNCPMGCCTEAGVCVAGGENAACGSAGNACTNCINSNQVCGNGACVVLSSGGGTGGTGGTGGGGATGGGGGASGGGTGGGGAFTCTRTPVECSDQAIQTLDLKSNVAAGVITTMPDGTGSFRSTIDATGGGFTPTESYVYARFTDDSLEKLPISDMTALDSMDWDIAFRRYVIRINSGDSGPSCVGAEVQPVGATFESITGVPPSFLPEGDDFLTRPAACVFIDDGSGLGTSPRTYLSTFYQYAGCVAMTGRVYVLRTQYGRHVKLTVTTYYSTVTAQNMCNSSGSSGSAPGGTIRLRWQYLD